MRINQRHQAHIEWLRYVEVNGPFLSLPVLATEWPDLEPLVDAERDRLRRAHRPWLLDAEEGAADWINYVLTDLLGWGEAVSLTDDLSMLSHEELEHSAVITPSFGLRDPATGDLRLLGLISKDSPVARIKESDWSATPADRLARLCRVRGVELGLATNGRWWALVWAPAQGVSTVAVFDSATWSDAAERPVVRAFISLLQRRRFFAVPPERRLPALLWESLKNQEAITDRLGVQVRQAVELLVAAFGRIGAPAQTSATEVYRGAVTMLMRLVFLFFAEATSMLPTDNALYASSYSVTGLFDELERRVADALGNEAELQHTSVAWHRILALCAIVDRGINHQELRFAGHDGSLFDPARHPWLPLTVDDRTVLHLLRSVQTVTIAGERRTVSFRTFSVEQIGFVYEGLLSYEGFRASEVVVGLIGKDGQEAEVPLAELEALGQADLPARLADKYKATGIGSSRAVGSRLAPLSGDELARAESRLYAITQALTRRLLPFDGIIRRDLRGDPLVILPGQLYVTESALRASTGTHYTPRELAERVVEGALEPLVYNPGPLQTADRSRWRPVGEEAILGLRVADIAMGSGAFLVAACRYLADKLVGAWARRGNLDAQEATTTSTESGLYLDVAAPSVVIKARRLIIENCLYGVDVNEMAVQMAKLSLWLFSMDRERPFTFLDDRLVAGDSLLGITSADQLMWMHWNPAAGRALHSDSLLDFTSGFQTVLREAAARRRELVDISSDSLGAIKKKRELLADVRALTAHLIGYANLLSGAAMANGRWLEAAQLANEAAVERAALSADEQAVQWLATDLPDGAFDRVPLHWPLIFTDIFDVAKAGFDAIVGNPPFLGGTKITRPLGVAYREYLIKHIADGIRAGGRCDLVAYFLLRAHGLLNVGGQTGLIATNTLAQGDTREIGLDRIVAQGIEIRRAIKSKPWPSKSAILEYAAVWTSRARIDATGERISDGIAVNRITSSLDPASRVSKKAERLVANAGIAFEGSKLDGIGFTVEPDRAAELIARDARNRDILFPYLNGQDLNSRPDCSASRWVINFHNWPLEKSRTYIEPFAKVVKDVKPQREQDNRKAHRDYWWHYAEKRPGMISAIAELRQVIVITKVSKVVMPVMVPTGQVFAHKLGVFATDDTAILAILSSALHYWWAISRSSTMKADLNYSPSDVFDTFPLPGLSPELRSLGSRLDTSRRNLMLCRHSGLTTTYNLVHDQSCTDSDIAELRDIHCLIDVATVRTYGWTDLADSLGHGFHATRQGTRYTIAPAPRQEILDRLLELNHARHSSEVEAGRYVRKGSRRRLASGPADGESPLF